VLDAGLFGHDAHEIIKRGPLENVLCVQDLPEPFGGPAPLVSVADTVARLDAKHT